MKKHNAHSLTAAHLYTETLLSSWWLGCRCLRFWSTLGNVFLLFTAFTIHVGESRAPRTVVPRSTFGGSKRSILQFPNGISPDDEVFPSPMGCSFWTVGFFSSPVSFSRFVLNVIQLFAPIIFTWFSLIFNDSCVFILFKSLPYCKRVFSQVFLRWTELNYCDYHQCNGTSRRCYCLYSFLSNESLQSGNAVSVQSTERNQFSFF